VPIGASAEDVIAFGGGLKEEAGKVLFGGPMMGTPIWSLKEPVIKTTGAITVMTRAEALQAEATACIHCGRCVSACPMFLNPTAFSRALGIDSKEERIARLEETKVALCMECGCCSYVCPANRPLVQNNRLAKGELRDHKAHQASLKK
jgi:electron transport complex protein RnfC